MNFLRQLHEQNKLDIQDVLSKLRGAEQDATPDYQTSGFAIEDEKGNIVRVRVPKEQAADFEHALGTMLDDIKDTAEELDTAEVLFNLRKKYDILDVRWGDGTVEEEEEGDEEPVDADAEGPEGKLPSDDGQIESDGDGEENPPMDAEDVDVGFDDGAGGAPADTTAADALQQVIDLLKSDAEARKQEAEARKAEASVEAGKVAASAASARTRSEEEILDMENFNKRKKEEKRQRDLRAKLIKYRHAVDGDLNNKTGELDMGLGESYESVHDEITQEEEELLDMEKWHAEEAENKRQENIRKKLNQFRHAQKNKKDGDDKFQLSFKEFQNELKSQAEDQQDDVKLAHKAQY